MAPARWCQLCAEAIRIAAQPGRMAPGGLQRGRCHCRCRCRQPSRQALVLVLPCPCQPIPLPCTPNAGGWSRQVHARQRWPLWHATAGAPRRPGEPGLHPWAWSGAVGFLWQRRPGWAGAGLLAHPSAVGPGPAWQPCRPQPWRGWSVCQGQGSGARPWRCNSQRQPGRLCRGAQRAGRRQAVWARPGGGGLRPREREGSAQGGWAGQVGCALARSRGWRSAFQLSVRAAWKLSCPGWLALAVRHLRGFIWAAGSHASHCIQGAFPPMSSAGGATPWPALLTHLAARPDALCGLAAAAAGAGGRQAAAPAAAAAAAAGSGGAPAAAATRTGAAGSSGAAGGRPGTSQLGRSWCRGAAFTPPGGGSGAPCCTRCQQQQHWRSGSRGK